MQDKANYKSYLKLKIPKQDNVMGLSWEQYKVVRCDYKFHRGINRNGEICTDMVMGVIRIELAEVPTDNLMGWVFDHFKKYNGEITLFDAGEATTLEQVFFENARCVDFTLCYKPGKKPVVTTNLTIAAERMQIGNVYFENER